MHGLFNRMRATTEQRRNLRSSVTAVKKRDNARVIDGTGAARVDGWVAADVTFTIEDIDNSAGTYRGDSTIHVVHAATTFDYVDVGFLAALGLPALSVTATHEQRAIRE